MQIRLTMWILLIGIFIHCGYVCGSQSFLVAPNNKEVIQGQTVTLECQVQDLAGTVQWTKDAFALGFDRDIPGYERYSMIGNKDLGEYHLLIRNAELSDDTVFECQVGPGPSGDTPLVGPAVVSVIVPVQTLRMEGHAMGDVVSVPHEQEVLNLTCIAAGGKPAGTVKWFRNNAEITADISSSVESFPSKLENTRSVLSLKPKSEDNNANYTCQVNNPAAPMVLTVQVTLSVMYPPGEPQISGYRDGQIVSTDDTVILVCRSRGGNPLPRVYWSKNGQPIDFMFTVKEESVRNELQFTVQPSDHEAVYRCEVSNTVTPQPLTAEVKLKVLFGPAKVKITGDTYAKAGETIKLKCETAISNPAADITWFSSNQEISDSKVTVKASPKGGYITTSEIEVELKDTTNDVMYTCYGLNNEIGKTVDSSVVLKVMYPPGHPEIVGYTEGRTVTAGEIQHMTCNSVGGNPPATVTWWKNDVEEILGNVITKGKIVSNQVSFILKKDDNGAKYTCNATNEATPSPLLESRTLKVNFPPETLDITLKPKKPRAGHTLTISCKSSSSNPTSEVSWWQGDRQLEAIHQSVVDAAHGGKSTISKLELTPKSTDNGQIYDCRATNILIEQAINDAVKLSVLFEPEFPSDTMTSVDIVEYGNALLNLTAKGNPKPKTYTWFKDGVKLKLGPKAKRDVSIPHFIQNGAILNITNITREDAGVYTVKAVNDIGFKNYNITINVQYSAVISTITSNVMYEQSANGTINCSVDANPRPDTIVTWSRVGYDFARSLTRYENGKSTLVLYNLVKEDTGEFLCTANNGIGDSVSEKAQLIVKYPPILVKDTGGKAAADKGDTAKLTCRAQGAPEITFKWLYGSADIDVSGTKFKQESKKTDVVWYESSLFVYNTTKADYGGYICVAENVLGSDTRVITLDGTSKPDSPYEIKFVNATHNSITLEWKPGFDGGSSQHFRVRYQETGVPGYKYDDVQPPYATVYTVRGLKLATEYEFSVSGINNLGSSEYQLDTIKGRTAAAPLTGANTGDDVPLIIILTVTVIGMVLLGLNVLIILFFIRRKKRRMEKESSESVSQCNSVELYGGGTITDDSKSYTSRSLDDGYPIYDDDDEIKKFLGPPGYGPEVDIYGPPPRKSPGIYDYTDNRYIMKGSREPIYDHMGREYDYGRTGPYGSLPGGGRGMREEGDNYAEQLRKNQLQQQLGQGSTSHLGPVGNPRGGKAPPPPPTRSSSSKHDSVPPVPSRNYAPDDVPRYGPPPGSGGSHPAGRYDHQDQNTPQGPRETPRGQQSSRDGPTNTGPQPAQFQDMGRI